jgi:hypothetical protein
MGWVQSRTGIDLNPINILSQGMDAVASGLQSVGNTVQAAIRDPLPILLQVGGSMIGIPPYVTAAVVTGARGGSLGDIAKSAAIAYASSEFLQNTQVGADIRNYTSNLISGDVTDWAIENFNLAPETAVQVAKITSDSLNNSIVGGIRAAITGDNIVNGMSQGLLSGAILSGTDSFFDTINKNQNWGLSNTSLNLLKGASGTALSAIATNQDPAAAVGNYIAYASMKLGESSLKQALKSAWDDFSGKTEAAQKAQDNVVNLKAQYDAEVNRWSQDRAALEKDTANFGTRLRNEYQPLQDQYVSSSNSRNWLYNQINQTIANFNRDKPIYDAVANAYNTGSYESSAAAAKYLGYNAFDGESGQFYKKDSSGNFAGWMDKNVLLNASRQLATDLNGYATYVDDSTRGLSYWDAKTNEILAKIAPVQSSLEAEKASLEARSAELAKRKTNLEVPAGNNLLQQLQAASADYTKKYSDYVASKDGAERAAKSYDMIVAESAVRDAVIDAANSGVLKVESVDKDGNYVFDNGMTVTKEGKFLQDGKPMFVNAAGLPQNRMVFADPSGNEIRFDSNAGRVLSTTDVQNIFKRDYGLDVTPDVAKSFANQDYVNIDKSRFQNFAMDAISSEFRSITNRDPSPQELKLIAAPGGNAIVFAQDYAVNALDMPPRTYASQDEKVAVAKAFAQAREEKGAGATFTYDGKQYSTDTQNDVVTRQVTQNIDNTQDNTAAAFVKQRMAERLSDPQFNPADLSKTEINSFVDAYVKATPEQRVTMLRSIDAPTFNVIETLLKEGSTPTGEAIKGEGFGSIKQSDMTNYRQMLTAGTRGAAADLAGLLTRGGQVMGEILGIDTPTLDRAQELFTKDKNTQMDKLVGNEKAVAAGLASGLTSAVTWSLGGAASALGIMGGIAANNSWIEGANQGLSPEENAKRTAVMTALEIAGEAAGIPGMRALMKGIPITANTAEIINGIKRFGAGMLNEQASELLTTTAQMAADKWTSFGLAKNATVDDYLNALKDTAIATAAAVGTSGSAGTALSNLRTASQSPSPFSTDLRENVSPDAPLTTQTLTQALKDSGVSQDVINKLETFVPKNAGIVAQQQELTEQLTQAGVPTIRAQAIAQAYTDRATDEYLVDFLDRSGLSIEQIQTVAPLIKQEVQLAPNPDALAQGINRVLNESVLDMDQAYRLTRNEFPTSPITAQEIKAAQTVSQADLSSAIAASQDTLTKALSSAQAGDATQFANIQKSIDDLKASGLTTDQVRTLIGQSSATLTSDFKAALDQAAAGNTQGLNALKDNLQTKINDVQSSLTAALGNQAGAFTQQVQQLVGQGQTYQQATNQALENLGVKVSDLGADFQGKLNSVLSQVGTQVADTESRLNTAIAQARAEGFRGDQALQVALDRVSQDVGASRTDLLSQLGKSESQLRSEFSTQIGGVQAQIGDVETRLTAAINEAKAQGQTGDTALNTALAKVASDVGASKQDVLSQLGKTEQQLRTDFATQLGGVQAQIGGVETRLSDAIAQARSAGLQGDQALQAAIDKVAGDVGVTKTDLLGQLGKTEQQLRTDFASQIGGVQQQISGVQSALSQAISDARSAGLQGDAALQSAINTVAGNLGTTREDLLSRLGATESSLRQDFASQIGGVQAQIGGVENRLSEAIAQAKASGLQGDQALQSAIDKVAGDVGVTRADLLGQIGKTEEQLRTDFASQISGVQTQIGQVQDSLAQAISDAISAGKTGDAALQAGLDKVAGDLGIAKADLLSQLGRSEQQLRADLAGQIGGVQEQIGGVESRLTDAIAQARAAGLEGDQALQSAINKVSGDLGVAKGDLLSQLGKSEQQLRTDFASQIGGVQEQIGGVESRLNDAIAQARAAGLQGDQALQSAIDKVSGDLGIARTDLLSQMGKSEQQLRTEFATQIGGVQTQIGDVESRLSSAIESAKNQGLAGDQALQAAIDKVSSDLGVTRTDLMTQMGTSIGALQQQFGTQLAGVRTDLSSAEMRLASAIDQAKAEGKQGDAALNSAIDKVAVDLGVTRENLLGQIGKTEQTLKTEFSTQLGTVQQSVSEMGEKLADVKSDLSGQIQDTRSEIGQVDQTLNRRVNELMAQGQTYQQATSTALKEITGTLNTVTAAQQQQAAKQASQSAWATAAGFLGGLGAAPAVTQAAQAPAALAPLKPITTGEATKYEEYSPLAAFQKLAKSGYEEPEQGSLPSSGEDMNYFSYGQPSEVEQNLGLGEPTQFAASGGLMSTPLMASGGLPVVHHSGKHRIDFRQGAYVQGPGDGQSDDIPAMLADGEYVFDAETVAALGNGSNRAGAALLDKMREHIRSHKRSGSLKKIPPPSKSPLEYLAMARKSR